METRINGFGQREVKIQPNGLPAIWVKLYCDRCRKYQECLGFKELSDSEWEEANDIISNTNSYPVEMSELKKKALSLLKAPCEQANYF